jgi:CheY-like chemotaxis protein
MTRTSDLTPQGASDAADPTPQAFGDSTGASAGAPLPVPRSAPRVLLIDAERSLGGLLEEWLGAAGCRVTQAAADADADAGAGAGGAAEARYDLVVVDVPFPRCGGVDLIARITKRHPVTPILALSSSFFAGIDCCGAVARTLGVSGVCPWPASRETLIDAARRFLPIGR